MTDSEEVVHRVYNTTTCQPTTTWAGGWAVGINSTTPFTIRVSSDPNNPDTDDDGIGDLAERVLAQQSNPTLRIDDQNRPYHPRIFNTQAIVVYTADNAADGVVGPGQSFVYTTTAVTRIPLDPSPLEILQPAALGGTTFNATLAFDPLTFTSSQTATNQSTLVVQTGVASQIATITSRVRGQASGGGEVVSDGQHLLTIDGDAPSSTIDSLQNGQYVRGGGGIFGAPPLTLIIGGSANDSRSDIVKVEISVNSGAWQPVDGTASWSYALQVEEIPFTAGSGIYALRTRATDSVGNVETPGAGITIYADATAPAHSYLPLTPARLQRKANGQWYVHLRFNARDLNIAGGARPGSNVLAGSVEARLRDSKGTLTLADDEIAAGWQPATLTLGNLGLGVWELDYLFPTTNVDPTGRYALDVRASDAVGNRGRDDSGIAVLALDVAAPIAALSTVDAMRSLITDTITLSGVITDERSTVGIDTLDVAFVPFTQIAPLAEAVMRLDLNEPTGAVFFSDQTPLSNHAGCDLQPGKSCPTAGGAGRVERAVTFSGQSTEQSLLVADNATLNFDPNESFAVQSWYKGTTANRTILQKAGAYALGLNNTGRAQWQVTLGGSTVTVSGGPVITDNNWHHLVAVVDRATGNTRLYVDGLPVGTQAAPAQAATTTTTTTAPLLIGGPEGSAQHLAGMVDEVTKSVGTDLTSPDAPDTTLTGTPANPSTGPSATFSFVAVPGTNDLIGFGCQLDDSLYQPCAGPWTLDNLTAGDHTFRVRAIDSEGFVDASPASFSWTVNIPGVTPTPTATPVAPTPTNMPVAPTATNTPVEPTPTETPVAPTATETPVAPTATNTPVAPTATATPPSGTLVGVCGPYTVYKNGNLYSAAGWSGAIKVGTSGNNTLNGTAGRDLLLGLGGNDKLDGKGGDDVLCGGDGVDRLLSADGNDYLDGGTGNDVVNGGKGDYDTLLAGDGNDVLLDADGVISAQGGPGNDLFTIALRNGWRDGSGQPRFTGLTGGYGDDTVGLALLRPTRFFLDISGDERDEPPSPLEGTNDGLVLAGLIEPTSTIIKFERRVGAVGASADEDQPLDFTEFAIDPTTLTDESGAEFLSEPVGGDEVGEAGAEGEVPVAELGNQLFLPLVNR